MLIYFGYRVQIRRQSDARLATSWPSVEAQVISSKISEVNASDDVSFSTRLSVRAKFSYVLNGDLKYGDYVGSWNRIGHRDWSELLKPGSRLLIRVSPDAPETVSLVDYNGIR